MRVGGGDEADLRGGAGGGAGGGGVEGGGGGVAVEVAVLEEVGVDDAVG